MRQNFRYSLLDVIMLGIIKRQINSANLSYCGPVMMTGENVVVCVCEDIVISDTLAYYSWIINSIYYMTGFPRSVTKLVFGDGIISANLLKDMGIGHTEKLILDQYHLK